MSKKKLHLLPVKSDRPTLAPIHPDTRAVFCNDFLVGYIIILPDSNNKFFRFEQTATFSPVLTEEQILDELERWRARLGIDMGFGDE